jgi:hypothetical protein
VALPKVINALSEVEEKRRGLYRQTGLAEWTLSEEALQGELSALQVKGNPMPKITTSLPAGCREADDGKIYVPASARHDPRVRELSPTGRIVIAQDAAETI